MNAGSLQKVGKLEDGSKWPGYFCHPFKVVDIVIIISPFLVNDSESKRNGPIFADYHTSCVDCITVKWWYLRVARVLP